MLRAMSTCTILVCLAGSSIPLAFALSSPTAAVPHFFISGLGYCGLRLALQLRHEFPSCQIAGCVRSEDSRRRKLECLGNANIQIHVMDLDQDYRGLDSVGLEDLTRATHLVQTVAPIADLDRDPLLALHSDAMKQETTHLQWVGYLSSTGVYGDHQGDWVDEESELKCQDAKSLARVKAEAEWRQLEQETNIRVDCFRCGGIYGPGRGPLFTASVKGTNNRDSLASRSSDAVPKYVNRILVDDICAAVVAAVKSNILQPSVKDGAIYNLVDDDPAPRQDVMKEAQRLLGTNNVYDNDATATSKSTTQRPTSRATGNKRCRNQRLKNDFPDYMRMRVAPTYREGLAYLHQQYLVK